MFAWIALYVDWVLNLAKQKKPEIDRFRAFFVGLCNVGRSPDCFAQRRTGFPTTLALLMIHTAPFFAAAWQFVIASLISYHFIGIVASLANDRF